MKNLTKIIFLLGIVLLSSLAFAQTEEEFMQQIEQQRDELIGAKLPGPVSMLFGNERLNIYIDDVKVGVVTKGGKVQNFDFQKLENPTVNVYTDKETVESILQSEDPIKRGQQALDNKEITYEAVGAGKKIKFFFVGIAAKIAGWFI